MMVCVAVTKDTQDLENLFAVFEVIMVTGNELGRNFDTKPFNYTKTIHRLFIMDSIKIASAVIKVHLCWLLLISFRCRSQNKKKIKIPLLLAVL